MQRYALTKYQKLALNKFERKEKKLQEDIRPTEMTKEFHQYNETQTQLC